MPKYLTCFLYLASQEKSGQRPLTRFGLPALLFLGEIFAKIIDFFTYIAYNTYESVARAPQWGSDKVASANIAAKGSGGLLRSRSHFFYL